MSGITHSVRKIKVPDATPIEPLEWYKQVIDGISNQILSVDLELLNSNPDSNPVVRYSH